MTGKTAVFDNERDFLRHVLGAREIALPNQRAKDVSWTRGQLRFLRRIINGLWDCEERQEVAKWDSMRIHAAVDAINSQIDRALSGRNNMLSELKLRQKSLLEEQLRRDEKKKAGE